MVTKITVCLPYRFFDPVVQFAPASDRNAYSIKIIANILKTEVAHRDLPRTHWQWQGQHFSFPVCDSLSVDQQKATQQCELQEQNHDGSARSKQDYFLPEFIPNRMVAEFNKRTSLDLTLAEAQALCVGACSFEGEPWQGGYIRRSELWLTDSLLRVLCCNQDTVNNYTPVSHHDKSAIGSLLSRDTDHNLIVQSEKTYCYKKGRNTISYQLRSELTLIPYAEGYQYRLKDWQLIMDKKDYDQLSKHYVQNHLNGLSSVAKKDLQIITPLLLNKKLRDQFNKLLAACSVDEQVLAAAYVENTTIFTTSNSLIQAVAVSVLALIVAAALLGGLGILIMGGPLGWFFALQAATSLAMAASVTALVGFAVGAVSGFASYRSTAVRHPMLIGGSGLISEQAELGVKASPTRVDRNPKLSAASSMPVELTGKQELAEPKTISPKRLC